VASSHKQGHAPLTPVGEIQVILTEPINHDDYNTKYFFVKGYGGIYGKMPPYKIKLSYVNKKEMKMEHLRKKDG